MSFQKSTWREGESSTGYSINIIPIKNLRRLKIVSENNISPDNKTTITKTVDSSSCVLKANDDYFHFLNGNSKYPRYPSCAVVGWIKNLY